MKTIRETDVYGYVTNGASGELDRQMINLIKDGMFVITNELDYELRTIEKSSAYKDPLTIKTLEAVREGRIIPFVAKDPKTAMPIYMPFITFNKTNEGPRIAVDLTQMTGVTFGDIGVIEKIDINTAKLYTMLTSAYIYLEYGAKTSVITPTLTELTANVWSRIITRILDNKLALATNRERKEAIMYFAKKYFVINIIQAPPSMDFEKTFSGGKKSRLVDEIEQILRDREINIYADFKTFIENMLSAEITGLNSARANLNRDQMGMMFFINNYITFYGAPAGFSMAAFPYFVWMLISANSRGWIFNNEKVIQELSKMEMPKIMAEFYKMIRQN